MGRPTVFADNWPARARYWFPGIDHPGDKATVEFSVLAPAEWTVVSVGRLVNETLAADGRKLTVWATDRPIPVYTMVIGATEMSVDLLGAIGCDSDGGRCIPITQWVYPEEEEAGRKAFGRAPEVVAFFDSLIGPFPYEKLAFVQSSTRYGGMENSSAIFVNQRLPRPGRGDGLVAHEAAHQWFGDSVTEREWPHVWLSEGFATYFTAVFFEFADGDSVAAARLADGEDRYMASLGDAGRPVIDQQPDDLFDLLNGNSYTKGAWVLHMLRNVVGDSVFFEGIRRYYAEHREGTALTADLRHVMERASGEDLDWFFDQWLHRPGYPEVRVHTSWNPDDGRLELDVRQVQSWPPFRFPLEVEVKRDTYNLRRTFWIETRETNLHWSLDERPLSITVDPKNRLLGPAAIFP